MCGALPLEFEPNVGQRRAGIDYIARGAGFSIYLSPSSTTLALTNIRASDGSHPPARALRTNWNSSNGAALSDDHNGSTEYVGYITGLYMTTDNVNFTLGLRLAS